MKRYFYIFIAAALAFGIPAGPLAAQPSDNPQGSAASQVQSLESQADAIKKDLAGFDRELESLVELHNATRVNLDRLTLELTDSRRRLDDMRARHEAQEKILIDRLASVYKAGEINFISILLNSTSLSDLYEQTRYIARISEQDSKLEQQFKVDAEAIEELTDEIDHQKMEQLRLEESLEEQQSSVKEKIIQREAWLSQINSQVQQILQQEAERLRAEQARAAADAAALLQGLGISDAVQAQVVQFALQFLGVPYVWGGESPSGFDCSGLTKYVYARHGVNLPHNAAMQFNIGVPVPVDQLQPGDLVFWGPGNPHHVAMYIGQGKIVEAPTFNEVVKISNLDTGSDYAGARRYPLRARI